jgi:cupin fold WbuC family metalloprotein
MAQTEIRIITQEHIDTLIEEAKASPRKRTIFRLHEHHEPVQRMVNAIVPGSYVAPHKHEDPDKVELFNILVGRVAVLHFNRYGEVEDVFYLDASGPNKIIDIPPRTYHTLLALEPSALLEIIQGPYDPDTHKQFAAWAPKENTSKATDYLIHLEAIVHNWPNPA